MPPPRNDAKGADEGGRMMSEDFAHALVPGVLIFGALISLHVRAWFHAASEV
ncbi:MAG: hypothetical protein AAFU61_13655 [Pseudomonadota bacterium]